MEDSAQPLTANTTMNKDIKVGNFYHVLVKILGIDPNNGEITTETVNEFGTSLNIEPTYFTRGEKEAFFQIPPENGTKNSEPAPKYDPCRKFRKGDKVRVQHFRGRCGSSLIPSGNTAIVIDSEDEDCLVVLENPSRFGKPTIVIHTCFLELVTPVEEIERYVVEPSDVAWFVVDKKHESGEQNVVMYMCALHPHAKEAAEAECKRLNKKYRKKPSHD